MSKKEKLIERLLNKPKDFSYNEAKVLLKFFGFEEYTNGRTSGSRVEFIKEGKSLLLHKPHPDGNLKHYQVNQLIKFLQEIGLI